MYMLTSLHAYFFTCIDMGAMPGEMSEGLRIWGKWKMSGGNVLDLFKNSLRLT